MKYNFDEIIDRRNTSCVKFDAVAERLGRNDFIPLWVADMDFLSPPCVIEALRKRVEHGIFGILFRRRNITVQLSIGWRKGIV